jgi:hypothetical protein
MYLTHLTCEAKGQHGDGLQAKTMTGVGTGARRLIVALLDDLQEAHLQATGREHWNLRARVETDCGSDRRTLVFCVTGDHERSSRSNTSYDTAGVAGAHIRPWARVDSGHRSCAAGGM